MVAGIQSAVSVVSVAIIWNLSSPELRVALLPAGPLRGGFSLPAYGQAVSISSSLWFKVLIIPL